MSKKTLLKLGALAAVVWIGTGSVGAAIADSTISEAPDGGSLVAYRTGSDGVTVTAIHYAHQAQLVANGCVELTLKRRGPNQGEPVLANHCDYAVVAAYCDADTYATDGSCDAMGKRAVRGVSLKPHSNVALGDLPGSRNDEIDWVACRQTDTGVTVTLTDNGTHGECLSEVSSKVTTPALQAASK